ncbi:MAG: hypothetical protein R3360_04830 [Alphaproteobacteria bacterium]|nr:hypothetical protein [Alphaproteobacteria bacterium]
MMDELAFLVSTALLSIGVMVVWSMFQEQETKVERMGFLKGMSLGVLGLTALFYASVSLILGDWLEMFYRLGWLQP